MIFDNVGFSLTIQRGLSLTAPTPATIVRMKPAALGHKLAGSSHFFGHKGVVVAEGELDVAPHTPTRRLQRLARAGVTL